MARQFIVSVQHIAVVFLIQSALILYLIKSNNDSNAPVVGHTSMDTSVLPEISRGVGTLTSQLQSVSSQIRNMDSEIHLLKSEVADIHSRKPSTDDSKGCSYPGDGVDITTTHPGLMKHRWLLADAKTNPGPTLTKPIALDLAVVEENGMRFWAWNDAPMLGWVFSNGTGEDFVRDAFAEVLSKHNRLVLDVGSNHGYFSLIAGLYKARRVYAFDPQLLCVERITKSVHYNGWQNHIAVMHAFVSKVDGAKANFPIDTCSGVMTVNNHPTPSSNTMEVSSVNLDKYFLDDPEMIDLMKIDVEGAELTVLEGASELFKKRRIRHAVIEITSGWWHKFKVDYEVGAKLIKEVLVDSGYKCILMEPVNGERMQRLDTWEALDKVLRPPPDFHNQHNFWFYLDD